MQGIKLKCVDISSVDSVKVLWEQLNQHHLFLSPYFKQLYSSFKFEERRKYFVKRAESSDIRIEIAEAVETGEYIGYCISTFDNEGTGEIESIFIRSDFRKAGIGHALMKNALSWMDERGAVKKTVSVAVGNEQVFPFYERYGFYPRKMILEQI